VAVLAPVQLRTFWRVRPQTPICGGPEASKDVKSRSQRAPRKKPTRALFGIRAVRPKIVRLEQLSQRVDGGD